MAIYIKITLIIKNWTNISKNQNQQKNMSVMISEMYEEICILLGIFMI